MQTYPNTIECPDCGAKATFISDSVYVNLSQQLVEKYTYTCDHCGQTIYKSQEHGYSWEQVIELCKELGQAPEDIIKIIIDNLRPGLLDGQANNE